MRGPSRVGYLEASHRQPVEYIEPDFAGFFHVDANVRAEQVVNVIDHAHR